MLYPRVARNYGAIGGRAYIRVANSVKFIFCVFDLFSDLRFCMEGIVKCNQSVRNDFGEFVCNDFDKFVCNDFGDFIISVLVNFTDNQKFA